MNSFLWRRSTLNIMAIETIEVPIAGMDCSDCIVHVQHAIGKIKGVESVEVLLAAQKAVIHLDSKQVKLADIRKAVEKAGYFVPVIQGDAGRNVTQFSRNIITLLALVTGILLFVIVLGEGFGLFESITEKIPFGIGLVIVVLGGLPIFIDVLRSAIQKQITSRTMMTLGVVAALAVKQWTTAGIVVFMMHIGNFVESFTANRSRKAVRDLASLAPQAATLIQDGKEVKIPIDQVKTGDMVLVRPGEVIPVDGEVVDGTATINQSSLTGESIPVDVVAGRSVFASTWVVLGSVKIKAIHIGRNTTFGQVIKLVEDAESQKGKTQLFADKFSGYYLPIVAGIAALTLILSQDPLAATAVLVVACSCSIALATPIAMLASIGASAKNGLLIRGGKYLEVLSKADVLLIDKTGTLTLGRPKLTNIVSLNGDKLQDILVLAASAERYSEHPLAKALRDEMKNRHLPYLKTSKFSMEPGLGVKAIIDGKVIKVGNLKMMKKANSRFNQAKELAQQGKSLLYLEVDNKLIGILATSDSLREEVPSSIATLKRMGIQHIELLTGDNELSTYQITRDLDIPYQANLMPEDKIKIVRKYQHEGHTVVMVGDGINDAPALSQADIGIAMGANGTDIAKETADIVLLRDDWKLIPNVLGIAQRTMSVVKLNLIFTAIYNIVGIGLAAFGILPPTLAASLQSIPDLGLLGNSSRLLRPKSIQFIEDTHPE
jgi:Cu+-exporting ATPase